MLKRFGLMICAILALAGCAREEVASDTYDSAHDYFSFANTDQFVTDHLRLDLAVDFELQMLAGTATLSMRRRDADAGEIVLDTRDLAIEEVSFIVESNEAIAAEHRFGETDAIKGTPLFIAVPRAADAAALRLRIRYSTSPESTAL